MGTGIRREGPHLSGEDFVSVGVGETIAGTIAVAGFFGGAPAHK